jgi:alpha-amylase
MKHGNALAVLGFVCALIIPWFTSLQVYWSDNADSRSNIVIPDLQPAGTDEIAGYPLPPDWKYGAFMQIYVRGYKDSNGDGVGDLQGVIDGLDYLHDLGITGIWLMPITESEDRDHGYAVRNYRAIEPDYGVMADLERLLAAAHSRGIGVVLDYVINHASAQHPLFRSAASSPRSPHRDFFVWAPGAGPPGWEIFGRNPWHPAPPAAAAASDAGNWSYFAPFWSGMPDFNLRSAAAVRFHRDNIRFWLNKQVRRAAWPSRAGRRCGRRPRT